MSGFAEQDVGCVSGFYLVTRHQIAACNQPVRLEMSGLSVFFTQDTSRNRIRVRDTSFPRPEVALIGLTELDLNDSGHSR